MTTVPLLAAGMPEEQQAAFYAQLGAIERDEVAGVLLALFLGSFGLHHFYLRRTGLGVLYLVFCWTGIPGIAGVIECFLMPSRVRSYNLAQAIGLAARVRSATSPMIMPASRCAACGAVVMGGVRFCAKCGAPVHPA
jgi:TM2 domain-containing membrane protein YozV